MTSFGLASELDWLLPENSTKIKMIRHFGRILKTPDYRLLKKVYIWDKRLNESQKIFSWSSEVKTILYDNNLNYLFDNQLMFPVKIIVKQLEKLLYRAQLVSIEAECRSKPKLRTFITFKDFENIPPHVYKSLSFLERKMISKIRLGILPIRLETARYLRPILPENERLCYCHNGEPECEYHVLFICVKYSNLRQLWLQKLTKPDNFTNLPRNERFDIVLNQPNNVKYTAQYIIDLMDLRRLLNDLY